MKYLTLAMLCGAILLPEMAFAVPPSPGLMQKWKEEGTLDKKMAAFNHNQIAMNYDKVQKSFPTSGTRNVLVVLIDYSDLTFAAASTVTFYKQLFEGGGSTTLTWKKYYQDMSNGKLNLAFDVYGPYHASGTHNYYGSNTTTEGGSDAHPGSLVQEAVQMLKTDKDATVDFSKYDNDGDGIVDSIIVIHQGTGEESSGTTTDIWSHASSIASANISADGVKFASYAIQPEFNTAAGDSTIGVFCHEFGHVLGLPDTYDTTYTTSGVGGWSLMAGGSWNGPGGEAGKVPATLLAWERNQLGWLTPADATAHSAPSTNIPGIIILIILFAGTASFAFHAGNGMIRRTATALAIIPGILLLTANCGSSGSNLFTTSISIEDINTANEAYSVPLKTLTIENKQYTQYLLVENIVKTAGTWTEYLPGEGLLISKIDEYFISQTMDANYVNGYSNSGTYYNIHGVNIMQAGGMTLWEKGGSATANDTYPTASGIDSITYKASYSVANTNYINYSSNGTFNNNATYSANSGVSIVNIGKKGSTMTFDVTVE